jgi:pyruvate/2-oxoglutarate dehydrogenase complex dihydrolipoamide acyltransferase (E2) component
MQFRNNRDSLRVLNGAGNSGHPRMRHWGRLLACLAAIAVLVGAAKPGQQQSAPSTAPASPAATPAPAASPQPANLDRQTATPAPVSTDALRAQRQRQIAAQSASLLKLATDLKSEVDKTTQDTLSISVIRRADDVERVAHFVREKAKSTTEAKLGGAQ